MLESCDLIQQPPGEGDIGHKTIFIKTSWDRNSGTHWMPSFFIPTMNQLIIINENQILHQVLNPDRK